MDTQSIETVRFPVAGMTCGSCVARITRSVRHVPGVSRVRVDLRNELASISRDPSLATNEAIAAAVVAAGYEPDMDRIEPVTVAPSRGILGFLRRG